jgi:hypothetical protein
MTEDRDNNRGNSGPDSICDSPPRTGELDIDSEKVRTPQADHVEIPLDGRWPAVYITPEGKKVLGGPGRII